MTPTLLLLVVASAAIHVGWNALARSARRSASFPWLVNVAGAALLLPFLLTRRLEEPFPLSAQLVALAALSAAFEAGYFLLLQAAYGASELSIVYPLSRGAAPLLALVPARIWSGDEVRGRELAAIVVVVAGTTLVAWSAARRREAAGERGARAPAWHEAGLALLVGAATAAYQLVDRRAMQLAPAHAELDYLATMQLFLAAFMTVWWWSRARRAGSRLPRVERPELRTALVAALGVQAAYFLILLALRDGNVTLVSAARNVGIPLSLLAGSLLLREPIDRPRIAGAIVIAAGLAMLVS